MREESPSSTRAAPRSRRAAALDLLVLTLVDLPFDDGEAAVVEALLGSLAAILDGHAIGVCLVGDAVPLEPLDDTRARPRQQVFQRVPQGVDMRCAGVDPTRLFPAMAHERVFDLDAAPGSTLHVAADDESLLDVDSLAEHLARHTGFALGRALVHARAFGAARRAQGDLRALESKVIQADKLASFGQIAAGLVHELNNPLTSIVAYTDYLIRKSLGRADTDVEDMDRLRRISESANRMLRFTRDLVSYARPSGEVAVPVVVRAVIDQALAFCEHVLAEAGATVERRYGDDVLTVRGKPEQLTQVFVNLVTNACHALANRGGAIVITTGTSGDSERRARVTVHDDGEGIQPEHLAQVFVPFFTTKRDGRGTGLGLSIVRNIVEAHGGAIHVESAPGAGTTFVIELPLGR